MGSGDWGRAFLEAQAARQASGPRGPQEAWAWAEHHGLSAANPGLLLWNFLFSGPGSWGDGSQDDSPTPALLPPQPRDQDRQRVLLRQLPTELMREAGELRDSVLLSLTSLLPSHPLECPQAAPTPSRGQHL